MALLPGGGGDFRPPPNLDDFTGNPESEKPANTGNWLTTMTIMTLLAGVQIMKTLMKWPATS